ncbi:MULTISPECIES: prolyl oligopeptidase family serine peptidase [unclassified Streptomyces]|uniref:S9 family peptidase n=1 Tax=unclassified Streptomyces TaxID=2593676 RepID=UPI003803566D
MTGTATPYGAWPSPLTARIATAGTTAGQVASPSYPGLVGDEVWWIEPRPAEDGRSALVRRRADGSVTDVLPVPWNVRSRVIEYGGRPWAATTGARGAFAVFVNFADQRLYAYEPGVPGSLPRPLTPLSPVGGGLRWSEPEIDPGGGEVRCVLEEFTGEGPGDVRRAQAAVPLDGSAAEDRAAVRELWDDGHRFVSGARWSADGRQAIWLAWDHPHMPWDAAELRIADIGPDGTARNARTLLGGPGEPVAQAEWGPDGRILAAWEHTDWWNLYSVDPGTGAARPLRPAEEEFAGCQRLGLRWFAPLGDGRLAVLHGVGGQRLAFLDPGDGALTDVPGPWTEWLPHLDTDGTRVVGVAGGTRTPYEVVEVDTATATGRTTGPAPRLPVPDEVFPEPVARVFTGPDGRRVHAHVHAPRGPLAHGPGNELPPYVVWAHGGPGLRAPLTLNAEIAYFTSRGIGVVDVNYGGTPGYGRAYRERLREQWGVVDVEDCAAVARALVEEGTADAGRLAIRGHSAGGFTAALSLAVTDMYACAALYYPVLDLRSLAAGLTHDFESHYLDALVGPMRSVPERYEERSPAFRTAEMTVPFVLLQGTDDVICPPEQSAAFLRDLQGRSVPHSHLVFEGEGHGFRRQNTMVAALEAELSLYGRVFGFTPQGIEGPPPADPTGTR